MEFEILLFSLQHHIEEIFQRAARMPTFKSKPGASANIANQPRAFCVAEFVL